MKKIIALILAVIMVFSMTSVSYAADTTVGTETSVSTIDNYMDYLERKLEGENFFVQLIARLVIIGVMLGFIKIEDFEAWFDNTAPDTDTDNGDDNTTEDNNTNIDWEDGTELNLYSKQSLPYTDENTGITFDKIFIIKEHYDDMYNGKYYKYKYTLYFEGNSNGYNISRDVWYNFYTFSTNPNISEQGEFGFGVGNAQSGIYGYPDMNGSADGNGKIIGKMTRYLNVDYDTYYISVIEDNSGC